LTKPVTAGVELVVLEAVEEVVVVLVVEEVAVVEVCGRH
jgi:hypothetical protein